MPKVAEIRPIDDATRSRGNSSRMIPNASGKIAPPAPWTPRPRMSTPIDGADAQTNEPSAEDAERDEQHLLLAVHVAEAAEQRGADARRRAGTP